ncbi:hypothetical protein DFJ77DRAFT_101816 [Powellomyces hirtus]|nr:hypothetical protein DFJ77DRAFT_101816 [Powellomyces hirtus]
MTALVSLTVLNILASRNFQIHNSWTTQCAEYLRSGPSPPRTDRDLAEGIINQFLHSDIRSMGLLVLPRNVEEAHRIYLGHPRPVVLQVDDILEVGISMNSLLETIVDFKPKKGEPPRPPGEKIQFPRKMLRLTLTDGHEEVTAMECVHLPGIELTSPIGMKVEITNAEVRRGVINATPSNFRVLGGQVPSMNDLDILFLLEQKLRRMLQLEELPIPQPNAGGHGAADAAENAARAHERAHHNDIPEDSDLFDEVDIADDFDFDEAEIDMNAILATEALYSASQKAELDDARKVGDAKTTVVNERKPLIEDNVIEILSQESVESEILFTPPTLADAERPEETHPGSGSSRNVQSHVLKRICPDSAALRKKSKTFEQPATTKRERS